MAIHTYFTMSTLGGDDAHVAQLNKTYSSFEEARRIAEQRFAGRSYQIDEWKRSTGEHIATTALLRASEVVNG